jgi:hypothetical protein
VIAWLSTRGRWGLTLASAWNILGLLALLNVVTRAVLTAPGPLNLIHTEIPDRMMTGFLFPFHQFLPSHVIGIISLITLAIALVARYIRHLTGAWRWIYAVNVVISLYLNVFVLVAQLFQKIPALKSLAPTQSEPPFLIAQLVVMALLIVLGIIAVKRSHIQRLGIAEAFGRPGLRASE